MSLAPVDPADLSADDARELTDRIKAGVEVVWHLIVEAYNRGAHRALGYSSWDDYCTREFGTSRIRLPKEDRQEVVASLRDSGLSIRAIAAATGIGTKQVHAMSQVLSPTTADEDEDETFTLTPVGVDAGEVIDLETGEILSGDRVTGIDGKSYPAKDAASVRARRRRIRELNQSGHTTRQIADALNITQEAVSNHLRMMGLKPVASTAQSRWKRTDFEVVEKVVQQLTAVRLVLASTDLSNLADSDQCVEWLAEVDEASKCVRALRSALKGAVNG